MSNFKIFLIILPIFLTIFLLCQKTEGNTVYIVYPGNSIQEAVDEATEGATIIIMPGEYIEKVTITKRISLIGCGNSTVLKNLGGGRTITIPAGVNNVTIANFSIQGSKESTGIYIRGLYNVIENMTIANHRIGLFLWDSSGNFLRNNVIINSTYNLKIWGLYLSHFLHYIDTTNLVNGKKIYYWINTRNRIVPKDAGFVAIINSTDVTVQNLNLSHNHLGVLLAYTNNSIIWNCSLTENEEGIRLINSHHNIVVNNSIRTNGWIGISLVASTCNYMVGNSIANSSHGFYFSYSSVLPVLSSKNSIAGNIVEFNRHGIYLDNAFNNTLQGNIIVNNTYGVTVENSWSNVFYKNVLENECNIYLYDSGINASINIWNSEYPVGGNYWSNYVGFDNCTGPYQNETGSDGIGDEPFLLYKDNYDYYPLMSWPAKEQQPMIDFTFIPEGPKVGDIVHFIDLSPVENLNLRLWIFSDGAIYRSQNFSRQFNNAGNHSVVLLIIDLEGGISWLKKDFYIRKLHTTITLSSPTICNVGEKITLKAHLLDENNYPINNSKIHFYFLHVITKEWIGASGTDKKGIAELLFSFVDSGYYVVEAVFEGNANYGNSTSKCFLISKTSFSSLLIVPDNYSSIQEALDKASEGSFILVRNGVYNESVTIDKTVTLSGESWERTIIETNREVDALKIVADGVKVSNFLIRNIKNSALSYGIRIVGGLRNKVYDNIVEGKFVGIMLENGSSSNLIKYNFLRKNRYGIFVKRYSNRNHIYCNMIINSGWNGIELAWCKENVIEANTIAESSGYGIEIPVYSPSYNNTIFHNNFLNNSLGQASDFASSNSWEFNAQGNYWDDYKGQDLNNDGIGDTKYLINVNINLVVMDPYPLMGQYVEFSFNNLNVGVVSNLAIRDANFDFLDYNGSLLLRTETSSKEGFCRVTIPVALLNGFYCVTVNHVESSNIAKELPSMDENYRVLYIKCPANTCVIGIRGVTFIPEIIGLKKILLLIVFSLFVSVLKLKIFETKGKA